LISDGQANQEPLPFLEIVEGILTVLVGDGLVMVSEAGINLFSL
jgi:hypothetical protein